MDHKQRVQLNIRLQAYADEPIAEVFEYLKSLPKDQRTQRILDTLLLIFLPYARYHSGKYTFEQLRFTCWEVQNALDKHGSTMRLALGVEQPQFVLPNHSSPQVFNQPQTPSTDTKNDNPITAQKNVSDQKEQPPEPLIKGKASTSDLNSVFGD